MVNRDAVVGGDVVRVDGADKLADDPFGVITSLLSRDRCCDAERQQKAGEHAVHRTSVHLPVSDQIHDRGATAPRRGANQGALLAADQRANACPGTRGRPDDVAVVACR